MPRRLRLGIAKENGIESSVQLTSKRTARFRAEYRHRKSCWNQPSIFDANHLLHVASYDVKSCGAAQWRRHFQISPRILRRHTQRARPKSISLLRQSVSGSNRRASGLRVGGKGPPVFHERHRASPCDNAERLRRLSGADPQQQKRRIGLRSRGCCSPEVAGPVSQSPTTASK